MIISDPSNQPPTSQSSNGDAETTEFPGEEEWLSRGQEAYRSSTTYMDSNYRKTWDDSIRAFNSQHSSDSKYNQPAYEKRSRLYRPKVRSIIRKNEAAAAAAFFSNMDVVSVEGNDQSDKRQVASADVMKHLMQYRLTKSVPWFHVVLGGLQDAQNIGVVCGHVYWDYKAAPFQASAKVLEVKLSEPNDEYPEQSKLPHGAIAIADDSTEQPQSVPDQTTQEATKRPKPLSDKPVVDLIPVENLRIAPSADWTDPINSSPYVIHLMPLYVMDVKSRMEKGEWRKYGDGAISNATGTPSDSTRSSRQKDREDPYTPSNKGVGDYEICWVQRHIHRKDDVDYEFYMLGELGMLTEARPLKETVFHGRRPYVMGCCILETHKVYPSSVGTMGKGLQDEANEVVNQRIDNVKFVLNKKWFVKRGKEVDLNGLVRNVPGGITMMDDPANDVREISWPDVTQSAYEEQTRIDQDMNDLLGNFSPAQVMADHGIQGPARNMQMLSQSSGTLTEYLLRTYVETFIQPVLRQIVLLEQHYETDQVIIGIAANKAKVFQRFGIDKVTDELLEQELTLNVNVGMNATDPQMKLQKFTSAMGSYVTWLEKRVPGINMQEVGKEVFGHLGYSDGSRFFTSEDPQLIQLQHQLQQAMQMIQKLEAQVKEKQTGHQVKLEATRMMRDAKITTTQMHEDAMNMRNATTHLRALREADRDRVHDIHLKSLDQAHQVATAKAEPQSLMSDGKKG